MVYLHWRPTQRFSILADLSLENALRLKVLPQDFTDY